MALEQEQLANLKNSLWRNASLNVFAALDGASVPNLLDRLEVEEGLAYECLYRGDLEPDLEAMVPYLVQLQRESAFTDWVLSDGWGNHWGIIVTTSMDLFNTRQHLRKFNVVYSPENKQWLFRYYDPRVLRVFLPSCDAEQIVNMFGLIDSFIVEADDASQLLQFRQRAGALQTVVTRLVKEK